jgi:hypothetical protein
LFIYVCYHLILISTGHDNLCSTSLQDIEFMEKKIEDCEKVLKRSNAKEAKVELECCQKVSTLNQYFLISFSTLHSYSFLSLM